MALHWVTTVCLCRGALHFHAPVTGVINPYLLQSTLHSPMFSAAIARVYDSIVVAELPLHLHIAYLLERVDPSLKQSIRNYACKTPSSATMVFHSNKSAVLKNIHSSNHTDSCVNKFLPYCRLFHRINGMKP